LDYSSICITGPPAGCGEEEAGTGKTAGPRDDAIPVRSGGSAGASMAPVAGAGGTASVQAGHSARGLSLLRLRVED
jgi:hypothetical protein